MQLTVNRALLNFHINPNNSYVGFFQVFCQYTDDLITWGNEF